MISIRDLLLEYLKDSHEHPFDDFNLWDIEGIKLEDFLYWIGRKISK